MSHQADLGRLRKQAQLLPTRKELMPWRTLLIRKPGSAKLQHAQRTFLPRQMLRCLYCQHTDFPSFPVGCIVGLQRRASRLDLEVNAALRLASSCRRCWSPAGVQAEPVCLAGWSPARAGYQREPLAAQQVCLRTG